jgi:hypothetical protein
MFCSLSKNKIVWLKKNKKLFCMSLNYFFYSLFFYFFPLLYSKFYLLNVKFDSSSNKSSLTFNLLRRISFQDKDHDDKSSRNFRLLPKLKDVTSRLFIQFYSINIKRKKRSNKIQYYLEFLTPSSWSYFNVGNNLLLQIRLE